MNVTPIPLRDIDGTGLILGSQEKPLPGAKIVSNFLILLFVGAIVYYERVKLFVCGARLIDTYRNGQGKPQPSG